MDDIQHMCVGEMHVYTKVTGALITAGVPHKAPPNTLHCLIRNLTMPLLCVC
jgi:hypothetical protein